MTLENQPRDDGEMQMISNMLHEAYDPVLAEPVPARLARRPPRRWIPYALAAGCTLLGLGVGVATGWQLHAWEGGPAAKRPEVPAFVERAAVAHATYVPEVRHPVEVGADQEQHLVAWLSKRLGARLRVPSLDSVGYSLVGGRLLPGEKAPVAQFMYQTPQGRRLTLYVRTDASENPETAFRYAAEGKVKVFYWIDRKLGYALSSSDIDKDDLLKVANAVYRQLNP
ncbi:MAG TPA: anti-sigma factor [Burkholderiales bacterium]|nr:anti-sigma factor [Burkholderiales bacterium]